MNKCKTLLFVVCFFSASLLCAGEKLPVTSGDGALWERPAEAVLSPDGNWMTVMVDRERGESELQLYSLASKDQEPKIIAGVDRAEFSTDGRWLAYQAFTEDSSESGSKGRYQPPGPGGRGEEEGFEEEPLLTLLDLQSGKTRDMGQVGSFSFIDGARFLLLESGSGGRSDKVSLQIHDLHKKHKKTFKGLVSYAWQAEGGLLAINTLSRSKHKVVLYDPEIRASKTLVSGKAPVKQLTWHGQNADLAALVLQQPQHQNDQDEEVTHSILAWRDLRTFMDGKSKQAAPRVLEMENMRVTDYRPLTWSEEGDALFFGVVEYSQPVEVDENEVLSDVYVWHSADEKALPMQLLEEEQDRRRSYLTAWYLETGRTTQLGSDLVENINLVPGQRYAVESDRQAYKFMNMFDLVSALQHDFHLVDVQTGKRKKVIEGTRFYYGSSPTGRYLLYFSEDSYWTYEIATGKTRNITASLETEFVQSNFDNAVRDQKPPHGLAGWLDDDQAVILYDKYDIWRVSPDGKQADRLTRGAEKKVVYRYVDMNESEEGFDLSDIAGSSEIETATIDGSAPAYLSMYGEWTKRYGYARLDSLVNSMPGSAQSLVWKDKLVNDLTKAANTEVYSYQEQAYDDSPDFFVGDAQLRDARQVTHTNPFSHEYTWGKAELVNYKNGDGVPLQGALYYPANYEPGKKYPMIVQVYELQSHEIHNFSSHRQDGENASFLSAQGYFVFRPDIVFRVRDPGPSSVKTLEAAVAAVVEKGLVDHDRVGLTGGSWGGYQAAYVPTQTDIFATSIAGAAPADFISMYGDIFWALGHPETSHMETGQQRMEVPFWKDLEAYNRNSPVMQIEKLNTPILVTQGQNDPIVNWEQAIHYYNVARRAGKEMVLLVYPGAGHGVADTPEQQADLSRRTMEWFGHYLKGEPAKPWMIQGVSIIQRNDARRQMGLEPDQALLKH